MNENFADISEIKLIYIKYPLPIQTQGFTC